MKNSGIDILLVEDNQDDIELTLHSLRRENLAHNISVVRDGEEALDFLLSSGPYAVRANQRFPQLVLLDLKLPKVSGLEVLQRLKQNPATRHIPVVILTSSREECDLCAGYSLGANSYIQKPVDFERFRDTVKQLGSYWLLVNQYPTSNGPMAAGEVRDGERRASS